MTTTAAGADRTVSARPTILVLGGTGRTGCLVLRQLLARGAGVRAIVRSARRLPSACAEGSNLEIVEADLVSLSDDELRRCMQGCDAVVSCLGHVTSLRGVFMPPYDLVTCVTRRVYAAAQTLRLTRPVRFVLMSSVSVNHPGGLDPRRGFLEGASLGLLRALVPPSRDNQQAADFLYQEVGTAGAGMEWVVVRPDTLLDGGLTASTPAYALHPTLISSLFKPDRTSRANVARFICELLFDSRVWDEWRGQLPVIVDDAARESIGLERREVLRLRGLYSGGEPASP